jgi:PAS domain S-box-containing protein
MQTKPQSKQSAQTDALFESIGEGAVATNAEGNISRINTRALNILGLKADEAIGSWFPGTIVACDEDGKIIKPINRAITRTMLSGRPVSERTFYKNSSGKAVPVFVTVSPVIVDDKPVGAVEVFRDISSEYEIDRLKSEFISIASHQLRTPATAVKNFIGLLREGYAGELTEEQHHLVDQAYISNELQLEIVNNLLYAARAENEQVRLKLIQGDLVDLIKTCIEEQSDVMKERSQKLVANLPDHKVMITMDRQFIRMLIENLLTNASKYTPDGGKIIAELIVDPYFVTLKISDTGVGISHADRQKLFQRFSRIDNELSTVRGGSGIGLYLVKRIADLHNYEIKVASEVGKGSTFKVTIPRS